MNKGTLNKSQLIGTLWADPVYRTSASDGESVAIIRVATIEEWTDKSSNMIKERTELHRVILRNELADKAKRILSKGDYVYVEGRMSTRKWEDMDRKVQFTTELVAKDLKLLGRPKIVLTPSEQKVDQQVNDILYH